MFFFVIANNKNQMVHACWWYYFSKFTEFFDTVSCGSTANCLVSFTKNCSVNRSSLYYVKRRVKCLHSMSSITASCRCRVSLKYASLLTDTWTCFFSFTNSLVRSEVYAGRSLYILRSAEHRRAHCDVLLLPVCSYGSAIPEIPVVEEISDGSANGKTAPRSPPTSR